VGEFAGVFVGELVRGSPVGWLPGAGWPVGVAWPSGPMERVGNPGGGGINPPTAGAGIGMIRIPAAAATHLPQNLTLDQISKTSSQR
jgi:hypothetical protein